MRDIKFRGKRIDNNEFIYGWLRQTGHEEIQKKNGQYIRTEKYYQIQTEKYQSQFIQDETIGQYTGLKDKNGKEIYEGDIVLIDKENQIKGQVKYSKQYASFILADTNSIADEAENLSDYSEIEVIGNIYENQGLLEKEGIKDE